jgi:WD40-like Beta Propeller Repeat
MNAHRGLWLVLLFPLSSCSDGGPQLPYEPQFQAFANAEWSDPVHLDAPINSAAHELGASLSPDGLSLYFGSDRAGGEGAFDIWVSHRDCAECAWGAPVNLGARFNSLAGDGGPVLSPDGHLLFFSGARAGGFGGEDIWVARRTDTNDDFAWEDPVNLGPAVNTTGNEQGPSYVPALYGEGVSLYFDRDGDIYQALVHRDGTVDEPATPVVELNSPAGETSPSVRGDGREVFFWSTRPGGKGGADIWVATRQSPSQPWSSPAPLAVLNTAGPDLEAKISFDGRTLLFAAGANARPTLGFQDIWMSTRSEGN